MRFAELQQNCFCADVLASRVQFWRRASWAPLFFPVYLLLLLPLVVAVKARTAPWARVIMCYTQDGLWYCALRDNRTVLLKY